MDWLLAASGSVPWWEWLWATTKVWLPLLIGLLIVTVILTVARHYLVVRHLKDVMEVSIMRQLAMIFLYAAGVVAVIMTLPIAPDAKGQLLSLLGILITAAIALSSTTFIGNAMAGLMLRAVRNFRPGDFIRVGDHFGRVSEQGLLHTEVQTMDRELTTLPNLYLVTHPFTVVRSSGTIVSATVTLGYDVPRTKIEGILKQAASDTGLSDPFVQITDLGNFSVGYRIGGFSEDVKFLVTVRSRLRAHVLDALHRGDVEIVSPTFMNQRQLRPHEIMIPKEEPVPEELGPERPPEVIMFDKAETFEARTQLKKELAKLDKQISELESGKSEANSKDDGDGGDGVGGGEAVEAAAALEALEARRQAVAAELEQTPDDDDEPE